MFPSAIQDVPSGYTAEALRIIGQDLELRGIKTFAIRCEGGLFVVNGGYQAPPAITPVTVHYCRKDLEELNRKAIESGYHLSRASRFTRLSEILFAIATYIEEKAGRLVSVSNTGSIAISRIMDVEYETPEASGLTEQFSDADVHALCVREHKRKQKQEVSNALRFTRFTSLSHIA